MRSGMMTLLALVLFAGAVFLGQRLPPMERAAEADARHRTSPGEQADRGATWRDIMRPVTTLVTGVCTACDGEGTIVCPACGGEGTVERVRQIDCGQCGGSGRYESRIGTGQPGPCPFCRGTGKVEVQERGTCARCQGQGRASCAECGGTGRASGR